MSVLRICNPNQNVFAIDLGFEAVMNQRFDRQMLARANVVLPAMPRAGDRAAGERPFSKWAALVRANPVEGVELVVNVEQGDHPPGGDELARFAGGNLRCFRDFDPVGHCVCSCGARLGEWKAYRQLVWTDCQSVLRVRPLRGGAPIGGESFLAALSSDGEPTSIVPVAG